MDDVWKIILTAVGTLVVALIAALVGAALQARREHSKWLREQQAEVYSAFLGVAERVHRFSGSDDLTMELMDELFSTSAGVGIVGDRRTYELANDATLALTAQHMNQRQGKPFKQSGDALEAFQDAARVSLGLKRINAK